MMDDFKVPAFCPQCGLIMKGGPKVNSVYYKWKVCLMCFIEFIENRGERWESGWRPSQEQVDYMIEKLNSD